MRLTFILGILLACAASAGATYYLDERFDNGVPPPGWGQDWYYGSWHQDTGGPWGNYADVAMFGGGSYGGYAYLYTGALNFPQNNTAYYRFNYKGTASGYAIGGGIFYLCYYNNGSVLTTFLCGYYDGQWREATGTASVTQAQPVQCWWRFTSTSYNGHGGGLGLSIDNCQLTNEPMTAVAPTSLGRIKALFK